MSLWDRAEGEPDEAFAWWVAYRDQPPPRRLYRLRRPGVVIPTLGVKHELCNTWNWIARAKAWDDHLDALRQSEAEAVIGQSARDIAVQEKTLISRVRELALMEVEKLLDTAAECEASSVPAPLTLKLAEAAIKLARLDRGETTENVGVAGPDLSKLTIDEVRLLLALEKKARGVQD